MKTLTELEQENDKLKELIYRLWWRIQLANIANNINVDDFKDEYNEAING